MITTTRIIYVFVNMVITYIQPFKITIFGKILIIRVIIEKDDNLEGNLRHIFLWDIIITT